MWIRVKDIMVDPDVQRRLRTSWAQEIASQFDPDRMRVVVVSRRDDGYFVIDGQHRLAALKLMGYEDQLVDCSVFDRRSRSTPEVKRDDARLFLDMNHTLAQRPIEAFLKRITAEEPVACAVNRIVIDNELHIGTFGTATVSCVSALEAVYRGAGTGKNTPAALSSTLSTIVKAWGKEYGNFQGKLVLGIGHVFIRYGKEIEADNLIRKLAFTPGGAAGVIGNAGTLKQIRHKPIDKCVASIVVSLYNKQRRNKLEEWWQ